MVGIMYADEAFARNSLLQLCDRSRDNRFALICYIMGKFVRLHDVSEVVA
jgi:hypothetical protein